MRFVAMTVSFFTAFAASAMTLVPGKVELVDLESKTKDGLSRYAIQLTGAIAYPMADEIQEIFEQKIPREKSAVILHVNSGGGSLDEGMKIIAVINEQKERHEIVTTVRNGEICGSMCVPVYMTGTRRFAGETTGFMFHGVTRAFSNIPDQRRTREMLGVVMVTQGVSASWLQGLWDQGVFSTPGEYWVTGKELVEQNAGVVTELIGRHVKFEPFEMPIDPQIRPR